MTKHIDNLWDSASVDDSASSLWEKASGEPIKKKFGIEDLKGATNTSKVPDALMPEAQTIGGIALPLAAAITAPSTGGLSLIGLAAIGGAGGKAWENIYNNFAEPEKAPQTATEATKLILKAGGEEAAYEVAGQAVTKIVGKAYHIVKPKMQAGIKELQATMEKYGGSFTAAERTDSFLTQSVDSLVRGSMTGKGIMKNADDINDAALKAWQADFSNQIASSAAKNMTDEEFGVLVKSTLKDGRGAFRSKMNQLYGSFDDLVMTRIENEMIEKSSKSKIISETGEEISNKVISEVSREIRPVDFRPLKEAANELATKMSRINNIGIGDFGGKTLKDILSLDDAARFSDANTLRSTLLDISRGIKNDPAERKLYGSISNFVSKISDAMDSAALNQGDKAFIAYKQIQREANKGYSTFNDKLISSILSDKESAVKVGEMIYRDGNVDQIKALRKALYKSSKYDKSINPKEIWEQTQQKYIESVFNNITKTIEAEAGESLVDFQKRSGVASAAKLLKMLQNPKQVRTMNEMLSSEHRRLIFDFAKAAGITQQKSVAGLSMLIQLTQAGAVVGTVTGKAGAAKMAASILLPTKILAIMMSNPITARLMVSAAKTPASSKQAVKVVSKLMIAYENAKAKEEGRNKPIDDIVDYSEERLQAL